MATLIADDLRSVHARIGGEPTVYTMVHPLFSSNFVSSGSASPPDILSNLLYLKSSILEDGNAATDLLSHLLYLRDLLE